MTDYFELYAAGVQDGTITPDNSVAFDDDGTLVAQADTIDGLVQILDESFDGRGAYNKIDGALVKRGHRGPSPRLATSKES